MKKEYRVKKGTDIEAIIKQRNSTGNRYFVVYKKKNHGQLHYRAAVSVPKKYGNAVRRNKIKRQVRDIISKLDIQPEYDIFIVIKTQANSLDFQTIQSSLLELVQKQHILR
jgi:ribonuclease P protein component